MTQTASSKPYDLEERTYNFAKDVVLMCKDLPKNIATIEHIKQVVRSAGSVGANYIEANESLSKKDFALRVKICRKEAKESMYWLCLIRDTLTEIAHNETERLIQEAKELKLIFSSIVGRLA